MGSGLSDLFDLTTGVGTLSGSYVAPKAVSAVAPWEAGGRHVGSFSGQLGFPEQREHREGALGLVWRPGEGFPERVSLELSPPDQVRISKVKMGSRGGVLTFQRMAEAPSSDWSVVLSAAQPSAPD